MNVIARKGTQYLKQFEIEYIKDNCGNLTSNQIAGAIGCSQTTVLFYCRKMKIKCTKQYFQLNKPEIPLCINPSEQ